VYVQFVAVPKITTKDNYDGDNDDEEADKVEDEAESSAFEELEGGTAL
jgi:hypothetical protein